MRTNTLESPALQQLLARLYAQADQQLLPGWGDMPAEERARLMGSKTEYRALYGQLRDFFLPVSRSTGTLLYMLARSRQARTVVEFGTSVGLSTLHLAAALRDNGGGRLISTEFEPNKVAQARAHLDEAGLLDLVEIRAGDALETLRADLPPQIDLVLLDGAKALYGDILTLLEPRLSPGAWILADNADFCPEYVARVRSPAQGYLSVAVADDVELSWRIA
jgi:predicted O-methyltransferase YrrM